MNWSDMLSPGIILCYFAAAFSILLCFSLPCKIFPFRERLRGYALSFAIAGFALHSLLLILLFRQHEMDMLSKGALLQFFSWCLLLTYFISWHWLRFSFPALIATPLALFLYLASLGAENIPGGLPASFSGLFFLLHLGSLFFSFALLTLGFGASIIFLRTEKKLKTKTALKDFDRELPALSIMDFLNYLVITIGFPLYTLGLASGFIWAGTAWGSMLSWDPKEIVSLGIWIAFALLFYQRIVLGWRGKKNAWMLLGLFLVSALSIGLNFVLESHHSFAVLQ